MFYCTYDVYMDFGVLPFVPPLLIRNIGSAYHHSIVYHLYTWGCAETALEDYRIQTDWKSEDGVSGSYTQIDGAVAYSINGHIVTVELTPEILQSTSPVWLSLKIQNTEGTVQAVTPPILLRIIQHTPIPVDMERICDPCIFALVTSTAENESTISISVSGIRENFVTDITLEYELRPTKDNEPVGVSIDAGGFDLVNGHVYTVVLPVAGGFQYRAVMNYVDTGGVTQKIESPWRYASCTNCGGTHSWENCS